LIDRFHFQLAFKFCIVIYYIILGGCPYTIGCVLIYKLLTVIDFSNVTCVTKWMNKLTETETQTKLLVSGH
jgi:hypothetical protein